MTKEDELKLEPCPFCGGVAVVEYERISQEPDLNNWDTSCSEIKCILYRQEVIRHKGGDDFGRYRTKAEAITAWNTRSTAGKMVALDEEEILKEFSKLPNYNDELPQEIWDIFCDAVHRNDRAPIRVIMQTSTRLTHEECAKSICQRFSSPEVTEQELEEYISECRAWRALYLEVPAEIVESAQTLIAQAIHQRLNQRRE